MVAAPGLEPGRHKTADFHTTIAFATIFSVCGLDYPFTIVNMIHFRYCPSSLYTFLSLGLARDCHFTGFPEFEQFYILSFLKCTQSSSLMCLPFHHAADTRRKECQPRDSNSHALRQRNLNPSCLPFHQAGVVSSYFLTKIFIVDCVNSERALAGGSKLSDILPPQEAICPPEFHPELLVRFLMG